MFIIRVKPESSTKFRYVEDTISRAGAEFYVVMLMRNDRGVNQYKNARWTIEEGLGEDVVQGSCEDVTEKLLAKAFPQSSMEKPQLC